jgi:hypothetical protein
MVTCEVTTRRRHGMWEFERSASAVQAVEALLNRQRRRGRDHHLGPESAQILLRLACPTRSEVDPRPVGE